jgi:hypothetical protein
MCMTLRRSCMQKGVGMTNEVFAAMPAEERDFWHDFLQEAQRVIAYRKEAGEKKPFAPTESLCVKYQTAIDTYDGEQYCQVQQIREMFSF